MNEGDHDLMHFKTKDYLFSKDLAKKCEELIELISKIKEQALSKSNSYKLSEKITPPEF